MKIENDRQLIAALERLIQGIESPVEKIPWGLHVFGVGEWGMALVETVAYFDEIKSYKQEDKEIVGAIVEYFGSQFSADDSREIVETWLQNCRNYDEKTAPSAPRPHSPPRS